MLNVEWWYEATDKQAQHLKHNITPLFLVGVFN